MSAPLVCSLRPKTLNETQAAIFICPRLIPACYPASCPYIPVSQRSPAPYSQGVSENGLPSAHVALLSVLFQTPFKLLFRESDGSQTLSAFLPQLALALKLCFPAFERPETGSGNSRCQTEDANSRH